MAHLGSFRRTQPGYAIHPGCQTIRDLDRSVLALMILQYGHQRAADGKAGTVQSMYRLRRLFLVGPEPRALIRRAWKSRKLLQEEISRYAFWLGNQTSRS